MYYSYIISNTKPYTVTSPEFPNIKYNGQNQEAAFNTFLTNVFNYIKECLKSDIRIPDNQSLKRVKSKTFGLPLNMILKIKLHNIRVEKKITRKELSQFLAVTHDEMRDLEWNIENLKKISSNKQPKYKNVQRLFDLSHESTVREVESAYRVLGFNVSIVPTERF